MCGRYGLYRSQGRLIEHFGLASAPSLKARYNIAPGDAVGVVRIPPKYDQRVWDQLRWGLIPSWAKDKQIGYRMINARAETLAQKPSFRDAFKYQRCLVPADVFYEWTVGPDGKKYPYAVCPKDEHPFAFAGLFSILLLSKIPVIRRGLNREAEAQGNPKHKQSQKIMWKLVPWIAIPTFTISIIAAVY